MMEYSELGRARMVRRMIGPGAVSGAELARETGIPQPTLSRWLRGAASLRLVSSKPEPPNESEPAAEKRPQDWSPMERTRFVLDADGLGEQELGELLRRRGVHRYASVPRVRSALPRFHTRAMRCLCRGAVGRVLM